MSDFHLTAEEIGLMPPGPERTEATARWHLDFLKKDRKRQQADLRDLENRITELEGKYPRRIKYLDLAEIAKNGIPRLDWLIDGWIVKGDVAMVAGSAGIGKTTLGADIAVGAALGSLSHLGLHVIKPLRVLYLDEEQGEDMTARLMIQLGAPAPGLKVASGQRINLATAEGVALVEQEIRTDWPELVIVDSVQQTFGVEEASSSTQIGSVYANLFQLRDTYKTTFLFLHHLKKRGSGKVDLLDLVRDSTAHTTQCSAIWAAEGESQDAMRLTGLKRRGAPKPSMIVGYREGLEGRIHLERRPFGEPVT